MAARGSAGAPAGAPSTAAPQAGGGGEADRTLSPWLARQADRLLRQRGHAWLLQGPSGLGQYRLALELVRAWLCDRPTPAACGSCGSCHAIDVRTHADLHVLMPETAMLQLGWPLGEKAQSEVDDKKRKPSREIRVDAMREATEFAQRTDARGRGKAVLVYPAEQMNAIAANALLKTLEEPTGAVRFVLASEAAHQLLPTIRSRCQVHTLEWPQADEMAGWLDGQGVPPAEAEAFLRMAGGRPEDALALARSGRSPAAWSRLPRALAQGDGSGLAGWPADEVVESLQKLCHDLMARAADAPPRYFAAADLPSRLPGASTLAAWSAELRQAARTASHPFHAGLMLDALVARARNVLNSPASR
ncbi:MAG: DNA polymerase III subunit delta' [Xylophilus ampelinus]